MVEPAYPERRGASAIDKYAFQLAALLKTEASKSRKQRRTLKQIHEDLKELGFEGSYDRVAAFAKVWREGQIDRVNSASKQTSLRRAEIILTTDMPKLSYEQTEPLLELVDNLLKKVDGSSKEKLASILKRERTMVNRNNALEKAKDLDGMLAAMRDNNPYKE